MLGSREGGALILNDVVCCQGLFVILCVTEAVCVSCRAVCRQWPGQWSWMLHSWHLTPRLSNLSCQQVLCALVILRKSTLTTCQSVVHCFSNHYHAGGFIQSIFTMRCHASAVYAIVMCLFVSSRCSTEMTKHRITHTMPHDSSGTLVFWCQKSRQNSIGVTPNWGAKYR